VISIRVAIWPHARKHRSATCRSAPAGIEKRGVWRVFRPNPMRAARRLVNSVNPRFTRRYISVFRSVATNLRAPPAVRADALSMTSSTSLIGADP